MTAALHQELRPTHSALKSGPRALVWRVRLLVAVTAFAAVAFRQSTGLIVPDTKLDLTADPGAFLGRALHLWDPGGAFGQLQNQAYGYLFPVGPFHWALSSAGFPPWVVQRLWWTTIFATALLGMWLLTRALGVRDPWARLGAAIAFAAAPRFVAEIAVTSVEVWPLALSPWVLLPLVVRDRSTSWRASRSALAFLLVGAVNAAATLATLVLPMLWLMTRRWHKAHVRLAVAWGLAIMAVATWWIVPLLALGRFSPPFLSWIENASVTTGTASPFEVVRGTSAWLGFLLTPTGPSWPAAWLQTTVPVVLMATVLVAAVGLLGLRFGGEVRSFLVLGLVVGVALVTFGHHGGGGWPWASWLQDLLDGPLAAFRNTHKFELVVRIPITVGVALALERGATLVRARTPTRPVRSAVRPLMAFAVACVLVASAAPAVSSSMARPEGYAAIPDHWRDAAAWLDAQPETGSVLVAPSAAFADFTWGSTKDEPFQALLERPHVVRDAVPLGSAGATRLLDSVMDLLATGQRVERLGSTLAMAGVAFVLVRNDIRLDAQGDPPSVMVRSLQESGLERVATFGPPSGAVGESDTITVDYRTLLQRPSIEIYATSGAAQARLVPLASLPVLTGGPENLPAVTEALGPQDVLLEADASGVGDAAGGPTILTDGLRRREVNFGLPTHNTSGVLETGDPGRSGRKVIDYSVPGGQSSLTWSGVASVRASSSASDAYATLRTGPGQGPQQALDGDDRTRWLSGRFGQATGEWLQVDFTRPTRVAGTTITLSGASPVAARPRAVRVETDIGAVTTTVVAGPAVRLRTPPGAASWLRITLVDVEPGVQNGFSVAELSVPGVTPRPTLSLPGASDPQLVLLETGKPGRSECLTLDGTVACSPTLRRDAEELGWRRSWTATAAGQYSVKGEVTPVDGPALEELLALPSGWKATASSRLVTAPLGRPDAGIDGDPSTGWVASPADPRPWYEISLPRRIRVSGMRITKSRELPASTPVTVTVTFDNGTTRTVTADDSGVARFPPIRTSSLRLTFGEARLMENIDSETGRHSFAPLGFSELRLLGAKRLSVPLVAGAGTGVPCGFGPELTIGGRGYATRVRGTIAELLTGGTLSWEPCATAGVVPTPVGRVTVEARASAEFSPSQLSLRSMSLRRQADTSSEVSVERTSPSVLTAGVGARSAASVLVLPQNYNPGWTARGPEAALTPIRVNGWQQGFVVPAGPATALVAEFAPNRLYQFGLFVGALLALLVLVIAVRSPRRGTGPHPSAGWVGSPIAGAVVAVAAGGPVALLAGAAALVVAVGTRRRTEWLPFVSLLAAGAAVTARPFPAYSAHVDSWLVQGLVWLSILSTVGCRPERRPTRTRRMMGRSTR
ncbi:alpha-(1-_3)-arabinofuranosyltransferase family protein [Intrasporangium sp. DVR]|uniref:alpha-(1->3)-arabinofuranosyltransferase domain-containing protein n=1 Tax=Intrasporangium sp. DVR TaxID=3127867 RepID=UPI00313A5D87